MERQILYFGGDESVELRSEALPPPEAGDIQVRTRMSAISSGTEQLVYRGQVPDALLRDASIDALRGERAGGLPDTDTQGSPYPVPYGYACVGDVVAVGSGVDETLRGKRVFAFHPHASHFNVSPDACVLLPPTLSDEDASFLPNVETSIGLVMDASPKIGERVAVFGLGIVGLLSVSLLSDIPLETLVAIDPDERRRQLAVQAGAAFSVAPNETERIRDILKIDAASARDPSENEAAGADLVLELSGTPDALNGAISACGYGGRLIVGSWYGTKDARIDLGGRFHRQHLSIRSSQVSTIGPEHRARWSKRRRMSLALDYCERLLLPEKWTKHVHIDQAPDVYRHIASGMSQTLQYLFTYPSK